jgi:hypothetical protein
MNPIPLRTSISISSSLDSDLSSDLDLDLFQLPIEKGTKQKAVDIHSEGWMLLILCLGKDRERGRNRVVFRRYFIDFSGFYSDLQMLFLFYSALQTLF